MNLICPFTESSNGLVKTSPSGATYYNLECITDEADEPDPGWSNDQWVYTNQSPKYAIISDATLDESVEADLQATADSRGSIKLLKSGMEVIQEVLHDEIIKSHWLRYQKKYEYAKGVSWEMISKSLEELWFLYKDKY